MVLFVRLLMVIAVLLVLPSCTGKDKNDNPHELLHAKSTQPSKKVILLVADSLMFQAIDQGVKQGLLPTFQFMINQGQYYRDMVSSFPTMSVTIDSSLVTGTYPDQHHLPGLIWYSTAERRIVSYGSGPMEIVSQGINQVLTDGLMNLNGKHLNPHVPTIFEELSQRGLKSGMINGMIYRGNTQHILTFPPYIHLPTTLPKQLTVNGPDLFSFGVFTNPLAGVKTLPDGPTNKMGFTNEFAIETVKHLVTSQQLPDFLYVYLPDLDQQLHKKGPSDMEGVTKLDVQLRDLLMSFGSMEQAPKKAIIIVIGDSGMTSIAPASQYPVIELPTLLKDYNTLQPDTSVTEDTDLILAVNETMAYVYLMNPDSHLKSVTELLNTDSRMDLVAWEENGWVHVTRNGIDGELRFKSGGGVTDLYNQQWTLDGNEQVLDLKRAENNHLAYGDYPDGLRRLSAAFHSHEGRFVIVTAKEGYELAGHSSPKHRGGGGHGSMNKTESIIPMIICGTGARLENHRIVDVKNYLLGLLKNSPKENLRRS